MGFGINKIFGFFFCFLSRFSFRLLGQFIFCFLVLSAYLLLLTLVLILLAFVSHGLSPFPAVVHLFTARARRHFAAVLLSEL